MLPGGIAGLYQKRIFNRRKLKMKSSQLGERDAGERVYTTPIAIIGMASIFPQANTMPEYWDNILQKLNCVIDVPESRWSLADYYDPNPTAPDKTYCKRGAFMPDVDFDPMEFGLPPNILEITDVSQLLSLVVAKEAMEDAGYGEDSTYSRVNTGVVLGMVGVSSKLYTPLMARLQYPVWEQVLKSAGISDEDTEVLVEKMKLAYVQWEENAFPGTIGNVVAGRIANRLDLGGTNCVVDAACGSSLAAVRMAVTELITHRADMMITGGVDTDNSIGSYLCFSKTPAFSKGEFVRTFDAETDGMMVGEGIGMLVMKRLEDAERDGDRIYAVVRGIGSSSDGRYKSIYAPRSSGQAQALRRAYDEAGYSPKTVGLVEAHGTGTMAGDPAEFQGMMEVFGVENPRRQYIALGSVKSQIAHTKAAAGAASLIKASLALYHKVLPPTNNVTKPNPKLDVENSPFYINTETRPWIQSNPDIPRRAGVSSFGFGGTNFHVALEEYQPEQEGAYRVNPVAQGIVLSADTPEKLLAVCQTTLAELKKDGRQAFLNLADASRTAVPVKTAARVGFVAVNADEAQQFLQIAMDAIKDKLNDEAWEHPKGVYYRKNGLDVQGRVAALFSGQGAQYVNMGRELAFNFPPMRQVLASVDNLFLKDGLEPLSRRIFPIPVFDDAGRENQASDITRTEHAQPAIGAVGVGLYKLLQSAGFEANFTAGHSFGEWTALWAAGVLSDDDYYALAKARGKAMSPPDDPSFDAGTMVAVKGDADKVKAEIKDFPEVTLANFNSKNQMVLAGSKPAIAEIQKVLTERGYQVMPLPVSAAFHTALVGHAQKPFAKAIRATKFNTPKVSVYSNSTGKQHSAEPDAIKKVMEGHILNPVLWKNEIDEIYAAGGRIFIEFGPKSILTNLVKNILEDKPHLAVALNGNPKKDSDRQFREAVVQLRVAGVTLGDIDPYQAKIDRPVKKKSPLTLKLHAGYYMSEKTKAAFQNALKDGFKIKQAVAAPAALPLAAPSAAPVAAASVEVPQQVVPVPASAPAAPVSAPVANSVSSQNLAQFQTHQSETARIHTQYLHNEEEYARTFTQLTQSGLNLLANSSNAAPGTLEQLVTVLQGLERSMAQFHDHQAETLRVHEQYLKNQEGFSQSFLQLVLGSESVSISGNGSGYAVKAAAAAPPVRVEAPPPPAPNYSAPKTNGNGAGIGYAAPVTAPVVSALSPSAVVEAPAPVKPAPEMSVHAPTVTAPLQADVTSVLLSVVSDKTGYPSEMLELDMDMEADLGIDSIKRVEILGAMRTHFPDLPKVEPEAFAEMRTLAQVIEHIKKTVPSMNSTVAAMPAAAAPVAGMPAPLSVPAAPASSSAGPSAAEVGASLLAIVSDKTGYPSEMLELDMDMEADLGIDSIKRVEILGAMRTVYPDLPKVEPEAFAEMRTLAQVIAHIQKALPGSSDVAAETTPASPAPQMAAVAETAPAAAPAAAGPDSGEIAAALLSIVSDKTGYPSEMLELDMDMEADLGIDSIKRVEILGAMRTVYPDLPKVDPEAFSEMRTLGQVIEHIHTHLPGSATSMEESQAEVLSIDIPEGIQRGVAVLKSLPEPDYIEVKVAEGYISLVTDDGTATTPALVEILQARSLRPVVLSFPDTAQHGHPLPAGITRVTLADMSEEHLKQKLAEISAQHGKPAIVIHLNPGSSSETQKAIVKSVFLLAKHLKETLTSTAQQGRAAFMTVTRLDGEFGLGKNADFEPVSGGLFGLVKSLNLEWEAVFCRGIDLSPELDAQQSAARIAAELYDPNRLITEVAYTSERRTTLVVSEAYEVA
jgi:acyl transferase domain-containing protein